MSYSAVPGLEEAHKDMYIGLSNITLQINTNMNEWTYPCSAVGSESGCRSRVCEFDPARSHTFVEIDHEIISMVILLHPLIQEVSLSVTSKSLCRKLAQEKVWLGELTVLT